MKRPLFWVCMLLSAIAVIWLVMSGAGDGLRGSAPLDEGAWQEQRTYAWGRVCGKESRGDQSYFLLTDLSIIQDAAESRQLLSIFQQMKTDRIQCFPASDQGNVLPKIGSKVLVTGEFSFFREPTNPGEFDVAGYYQGKRIGGRLTEVSVLEEGAEYDWISEMAFRLRNYFGQRLDAIFPEREAGVMRAMLLGDRSELDPQLKELYQRGGIMHILSISGLHVTLLGMGLFRLLRRIGVRGGVAAACAGGVLLLYGLMTGMSVSAVRAIGMFLLRMLAYAVGRTYDLLTALGVMACGMLCLVPVCALNSGFWLSFGSMLGVGAVLPVLEELEGHRRVRLQGRLQGEKQIFRWVRMAANALLANLTAGFAVFLSSLPLLLLFYYEVATYGAFANLIVIPLMGPVVLCGFLAMLIPGLGFLGTVDVLALKAFEGISRLTARLPFSVWNPGCPKGWQVAAYYLLLTAMTFLLWRSTRVTDERGKGNFAKGIESRKGVLQRLLQRRRGAKRGRCLPDCELTMVKHGLLKALRKWSLLFLTLPLLVLMIPTHRMTGVVFLDVGQGDCILLRLQNGQTWICDCGSTSRKEIGENVLIPYLKHEGIHVVDGVFVSHGDADHVNGLMELFEKAEAEHVRIHDFYYAQTLTEENKELMAAARVVNGLRFHCVATGDVLRGKGITFWVLCSGEDKDGENVRGMQSSGSLKSNGGMQSSGSLKSNGDVQSSGSLKSNGDVQSSGNVQSYGARTTSTKSGLSSNENSLCLLAELRNGGNALTILLTGDVEKEGEEKLLRELKVLGIRKVTLLKCAHHGSRNATSEKFLEWLKAEMTVISCGRNNIYGHPHEETLKRLTAVGSDVCRTDYGGCITVRIRGGRVTISEFK